MTKKLLQRISYLVFSLVVIIFGSCSNDDNPGDESNPYNISWKSDAEAEPDKSFLVQPDGGTFTFDFYRGEPWLAAVKETLNGKSILTIAGSDNNDKIEASWTTANIVKSDGNNIKLTVTILPSDATVMRYIYVVVENSVQSKTITFKQFGIYSNDR